MKRQEEGRRAGALALRRVVSGPADGSRAGGGHLKARQGQAWDLQARACLRRPQAPAGGGLSWSTAWAGWVRGQGKARLRPRMTGPEVRVQCSRSALVEWPCEDSRAHPKASSAGLAAGAVEPSKRTAFVPCFQPCGPLLPCPWSLLVTVGLGWAGRPSSHEARAELEWGQASATA